MNESANPNDAQGRKYFWLKNILCTCVSYQYSHSTAWIMFCLDQHWFRGFFKYFFPWKVFRDFRSYFWIINFLWLLNVDTLWWNDKPFSKFIFIQRINPFRKSGDKSEIYLESLPPFCKLKANILIAVMEILILN